MKHYPPYRDPNHTSLAHVFGWLLLALLLLTAGVALGQELPETPKPQKDHLETCLLIADAASHALDVYSTHQMLARGNRELFLPSAITNHTWPMAAYSASAVALDWWVSHKLEHHGHRKLARLVTAIDLGQDAPWAIHNLFLKKQPEPITVTRELRP